MKIQYASDLHLEFGENSKWLKSNPLLPSAEILILAGDIDYLGDSNYVTHPFWDKVSEDFKKVIVIPGNHELYKLFDINELHEGWNQEIRSNVHVHYNSVITHDDNIKLIASTLWSNIPSGEVFDYSINPIISRFKSSSISR